MAAFRASSVLYPAPATMRPLRKANSVGLSMVAAPSLFNQVFCFRVCALAGVHVQLVSSHADAHHDR